MIVKRTIGSVFFTYEEEYPSEEKALNKVEGKFKEVKLDKLRIERVKITKENDDNKSEDSTKTKGQRTEKV